MAALTKIDMDLPAHRAQVLFRGQQKPCFVIHSAKLADDLKSFREIARILRRIDAKDPKVKHFSEWLERLAQEYRAVLVPSQAAEGKAPMIRIPLTQVGSAEEFAKAVQAHVEAVTAHLMGPAGKPAPRAHELVEAVIRRIPQDGPVATRGPDRFEVVPYQVFDDRPVSREIQLLRDSINQGA